MYQEKRAKVEEGLKQLNNTFKYLRVMYEKVSELVPEPDDPAEEVDRSLFTCRPYDIISLDKPGIKVGGN